MADEQGNIDINVNFDGAQQSAQQLSQVTRSLAQVDEQADATQASTAQVGTNFGQLASGGQQLAQRFQGVASAAQQLVSAMGSSNRTAGLFASVAGSVAQFSAMGSMLGPGGTVLGGLAGLAAGAFAAAESMDQAESAAGRFADALVRVREETARNAAITRENAITTGGDALAGLGLSAEDIDAALNDRRRRLAEFQVEVAGGSMLSFLGVGADPDDLHREMRELEAEIDGLVDARDRLAHPIVVEEGEVLIPVVGSGSQTRNRRRGGGGGGGGGEDTVTTVDFNERYREERAAVMTERLEMTRDILAEELDAELAHQAAVEEVWREAADREIELQAEVNEALAEAEEDYQERLAEGRQAQKDAETDLLQSQLEEREDVNKEMMGLLGDTTSMLGDAIKDIATGEKSAEEAFKGLAAAFLEMISEYASLKAATEFADAGASFARYDYAGGAAHIGAGVAFTAVAVATGIGAAAINSAPQAPARPEAGQQPAAGGRGGDVVINWNSPVVTAGTRAELGRELNSLAAEGAAL